MVVAIRMEIDKRKLTRLQKNYPRALSAGMIKWGNTLAGFIKLSLRAHMWRGKLLDSVRWEQRPRGKIGALKMLQYGLALDRMRPHFVALKRGRKITKWAKEHGIQGKGVFVKPHPYIDRILNKHIPKLPKFIALEVQKAAR